jgi:uncharacterized membrane protein YoaK (UPF0700 family)
MVMLSAIAGMSDAIGFITLGGLFTAHVTGNAVVIAALLVKGGPIHLPHILAIPVFMIAVAIVWFVATSARRSGPAPIAPLLRIQLLLLTVVLAFSVNHHAAEDPHGAAAGIAGLIAVSAMGCQAALSRAVVSGSPTTGAITGNLTMLVLSLLDTLSGPSRQPILDNARERLKTSAALVAGFLGGCVAGAAASSLGDWAWSLPVALAALAARHVHRDASSGRSAESGDQARGGSRL